MEKLTIENLSFCYQKNDSKVLNDLNLKLPDGTMNLLFGPSGCGKSTLMKIIAGLYPEYAGHVLSGTINFNEQSTENWTTRDIAKHIAILFQNPTDQFSMTTVKQEFIFTLENLGYPRQQMDQRIQHALERLDIAHFIDRRLDSLSGGELQKVSLAITLAMDCDLIILDEPFACIDLKSRQQLLKLLKDLQVNDGKTILVSDHDLMGYQDIIDNLFHFQAGQIVKVNDTQRIFQRYQKANQSLQFSLPEKSESIVDLCNLQLKNGQKLLITDSSLEFSNGKLILLTGENGSGKSTLFSALTKLHDYSGLIEYQHKNIQKYNSRKYARQIGLVFQDAQMQYLKLTLQEEIDLSLKHTRYQDFWTKKRVKDYLQLLHLDHLREHIVYQLSGGQKKKLQIFEMLILGNPVLLLDEPLSGLDLDSTKAVMEMIKSIASQQSQTIVMISHQLGGLNGFFDYHLQLADQKLSYTEVLNYESIS